MYEIYIEFLKKYNLYDKEVFDFIKDKTVYVDYMNTDSENFIGVYPIVDKDNIVRDLRMCVPNIVDDISISMNIHEYVHLIKMYCQYSTLPDHNCYHFMKLSVKLRNLYTIRFWRIPGFYVKILSRDTVWK